MSLESNGDGIIALYDSSCSSTSKGSTSWTNGEQVADHPYSASDGAFSYVNSPSDSFHNQHLMPPPVQGVSINDYVRESSSVSRAYSQIAEGSSRLPESVGSLSSHTDDSDYELASKTHASSSRSFSSCCSFMSKPIHPCSFPDSTFQDLGGTPQRETSRRSGNSSIDFAEVSGPLETECLGLPQKNRFGGSRCGLCERLLSQRSPWGSRGMVYSGDMPITGVLSCWHVYHAECLERVTPRPLKNDPPCPVCEKLDNGPGVEQWAICRLKNGLPRLRSLGEEGPSRIWSCGQSGDYLEGAVEVPKQSSSMLLRNRNRLKRQMSLQGKSGKERADSSKRSGLCSPRVSLAAVGCSSLTSGPALKRW